MGRYIFTMFSLKNNSSNSMRTFYYNVLYLYIEYEFKIIIRLDYSINRIHISIQIWMCY